MTHRLEDTPHIAAQSAPVSIEAYFEHVERIPCVKPQSILLTFPLRPQFVHNTVDLGLGNLYMALRLAGYPVNLNLDEWKPEQFRAYFEQNRVDVVGIKCYGSATKQIIETVSLIRKISPDTLIVIGGPLCYADAQNALRLVPADFAFHGECEESLPLFLDRYYAGDQRYRDVEGLIYKQGDAIMVNKIAIVKDINAIPYSAFHKMRPTPRSVNYYYRNYPNAVLLKSRGCPASCRFCANPFEYRERDIEYLMEEIQYLKRRWGVKELVFFDNNFNANKQHTRKLCARMIQDKVNLPFNVVHGMRVGTVDEETVELMARAGCYKVSIGVESGDQKMLDYINKGYKAKELPSRVGILKKFGIEVQAFVMIGLPYETDAQRRATLDTTLNIPFDHVTYNIYTPYPGTELYVELVQNGVLAEKSYDLTSYSRTHTDNRLTKHSPRFLRWCAVYYFLRFYFRPAQVYRTLKEFTRHPSACYSVFYAFYKTYINAN